MNNSFPLLVVFLLCFFFQSCLSAQETKQETSASESTEPTYYGGDASKKLDWAMFYLQSHYVDSTHNDYLVEVAIRSMLKTLDPFSRYQSIEELEKQQQADNGISEEGVGIMLYPLDSKAMITDITIGGPADKAGLKRGDLILKVDNQSMLNLRMDTIANRIKGPDKTFVNITYDRNGVTQELKIQRAPVPLHSVDAAHMLTEEVGFIKIGRFNFLTVPEFQESLATLKKEGMQSLILDLRNNLGGVVDASVGLADEFLAKKKLVIFTHSHNAERAEHYTKKNGGMESGKVVILVNQSTASASEIFTAAMQDWDRALVIGQSSYGKGLIQQSYLLGDGSAMRITIGKYFTPAGRNVQGSYTATQDWLIPYLDKLPKNGYTRQLPVPQERKYTTRNNRSLITDVGGITPDIYVPAITNNNYYNQLNNLGLLFPFAVNFSHNSRQQLLQSFPDGDAFYKNQEINKSIEKAFLYYAQQKIEANNYAVALQPTVSPNMINNLKAWIGAQVWSNNMYYQIFNATDPAVLRALESFENGDFGALGLKSKG